MRPRVCWLISLPLLLVVVATATAAPAPAVFSLAVGYNLTDNKELSNLKYADDDAVRNFQLMQMLDAQSVLLTRLDSQSKELFPTVQTIEPTRRALFAALAELNLRMDVVRRQGRMTVLYLFYSGHGDVHHGEGYVHLQASRFTRTDLLKLLDQSHADVNHVIIDACKSYFLVFPRGPGGKRRRATGSFLPQVKDLPDNTGFLLSTSSAQDSHEWEAFGAGIFSHEVRSALRGAADLDADSIVTYEEAAAFIYTANKLVPNRRYRPRFLTRPHSKKNASLASLMDLRHATARRLVFSPDLDRRYYVEDRWGNRLVDLHPGGQQVAVRVPATGKLFVRDPESGEERLVSDKKQEVIVAALTPRKVSSSSRGAEHESFQRLFGARFTQQAVLAYRSRPPDHIDELPPSSPLERWLRPALGIFAAAALATGGSFTWWATKERSNIDDTTSNATRQEVNQVIRRNNRIAVAAYIIGATAAAGFLTWTFWPRPRVKVQVSSGISLGGQAQLQVKW